MDLKRKISRGKTSILLLVLLVISSPALCQLDTTTVITDFSNGWMVNKDGQFQLLQSDINAEAIHFYLQEPDVNDTWLFLRIPGRSSLWVDNILFEYFQRDTTIMISTNNLLSNEKERLITIQGNFLSPRSLETKLVGSSLPESLSSVRRNLSPFQNYYLISFFAGLLLTVIFKMNSAGSIQDYFLVNRAINIRNRDEVIFKSKLLTAPNPLFYLVISFLASQLLVAFLVLSPETFSITLSNGSNTIGGLLWIQFLILGGFYLWILAKWIIVRYLGGLFKLSEFSFIHFFNYQRISFLFLLFMSVLLFITYYTAGSYTNLYIYLVSLIVIVATLRMVIILLKLLNGSSYKFLHLFSYLCATEIIPYLFAIKLILI